MRPQRIVLLEDDYLQRDSICAGLKGRYKNLSIQSIATERQFVDSLDAILKEPPDLFILDVMVRWTNPSPDMEPMPEEMRKQGFYRAGIRCEARIREQGCDTPVVLYTVLEDDDLRADLPSNSLTRLITKDASLYDLFKAVDSF